MVALVILGITVFVALSLLWRGYVLSILWTWFIVPQFGAAPLTIPYALGLSLVIGMFTQRFSAGKDDDEKDKMARAIAVTFLLPALVLAMGWIIKQFS